MSVANVKSGLRGHFYGILFRNGLRERRLRRMGNEWKVCTLDQAKRLVGLGVVLDTSQFWVCAGGHWQLGMGKGFLNELGPAIIPAPDVAELGVLLPQFITVGMNEHGGIKIPDMYFVKFSHGKGIFFCNYGKIAGNNTICEFDGETEAQARCAALIWLIESGHLKAEDIKL